MANPKEVLSPEAYSNYRNVRAVSVLFVLLGSIFVLGGVALAFSNEGNPREKVHPAVAVGFIVAGLAGVVGGVAAFRGSRRWSRLVYVMAAVYVFGFPIGTILSIVMFTKLSSYLDSVEILRAGRP